MTVTVPHTFSDGVGNVASGVQVSENFSSLIAAIEATAATISTAALGTDAYQAGVIASTDWNPGATTINASTGELSLTTFGGGAWLAGQTGGLVRTTNSNSTILGKPASLPGSFGWMSIGVDLAANAAGTLAVVSLVSGAEQGSEAAAIAAPAAIGAGRTRVRNVIIKNSAGTYAVAKSLDARPWALGKLVPQGGVLRAESYTVQAGEWSITQQAAPLIVTLPKGSATPVGAPVLIQNGSTSGTCTIATQSAEKIVGPGVFATTAAVSFPEAVLLRWNGISWMIVGGVVTPQYTALTLAAGVVTGLANNGYTAGAYRINDRVYLKGILVNTSGGTIATGTVIATVPIADANGVGLRPEQTIPLSVRSSPSAYAILGTGTGSPGQIQGVNPETFPNLASMKLDGVSYTVS